jgi:hypothetical protein
VAREMSVQFGVGDVARIAVTAPFIIGRMVAVTAASRIPGLGLITDAYAIRVLKGRLATYGKPEFATDSAHYAPVAQRAAAAA